MSHASPDLPLLERLRFEFRRNRRKTLILAALVLLALVMVTRLAIKKPASAQGQGTAEVAAQALPSAPTPVPAIVPNTPSLPPPAAVAKAALPVRPSRPAVSVKVEFVRDIFRPDPKVFDAKDDADASAPDDFKVQVQLDANALHLTSTMVGQDSSVMINGQLLKLNDWVEGFQVVKIAKDYCLVIKKGVTIKLMLDS